jgi:hypothetical protein
VLAGCGGGPNQLRLTLTFDETIPNERVALIARLSFATSGDENGTYELALDRALSRSERLVYRPLASSRTIDLAVTALAQDGSAIAYGAADGIAVGPGSGYAAEVTLSDQIAAGDGGSPDDGWVGDAQPGADLAIDPSLIAHYRFDEGSGTTASDSSGNGNNGTLMGGPSWVAGVTGHALSFAAAGSTVQVPSSSSLTGMSTVTVAMWVQAATIGVDQDFLSMRCPAPAYYAYDFQISTQNKVQFQAVSPTSAGAGATNTAVKAGTWYHVAGVYDGSVVKVYLNGVADGYTNPVSGTLVSNCQHLSIALSNFTGVLDEVRIYRRVLSGTEIMSLYQNP